MSSVLVIFVSTFRTFYVTLQVQRVTRSSVTDRHQGSVGALAFKKSIIGTRGDPQSAVSSCMPRLGSSLEGPDEGKKRRNHPLGRGSTTGARTNSQGRISSNDEDGFSSSHQGDEEQDRLLPSSSGSVNRPAERRVHSAYAGSAGCGSPSSARWIGIVVLVMVGLILRNALVNDYRGELIDTLRKGGTAPEDIERLFPKSFEEKKQKVLDDHALLESLHGAVAALRVEVDEIKERLAAADLPGAATGGVEKERGDQQPQPPPS